MPSVPSQATLPVAALQRTIDGEDVNVDSRWEHARAVAAQRQAEEDTNAYVRWMDR